MTLGEPDIVILHCSDTPDYDKSDPNYDKFGRDDIDFWHRQKGWDKIGYHFVVRRTGIVENGRVCASPTVWEVGAHCKGENSHSIGICYIGKKEPTKDQLDAIKRLYNQIKLKFGIGIENWYGHYQFNPGKLCPGFSIDFIKNYLKDS